MPGDKWQYRGVMCMFFYMSKKCGEYDEAVTYLIWVCCAPRKGKLDFTVPCLVVFLFNDLLLPFDDTATDLWAT